jgi:hypothetical protein
MTLKVLEKTAERLVIQTGNSFDIPELLWLALWVNFVVTFCFVEISKRSILQDFPPFAIAFVIGWLLIHFSFPVDRKENSGSYWFAVACGSFSFFGIVLLFLPTFAIFFQEFILPHNVTLTLDKGKDLFVIKSKVMRWCFTTQHPFNELTGVMKQTISVHTGAMTVVPVPVLQLNWIRSRDGKRLYRDLPFEDINTVVDLINKFLLETSR